MGEVDGASLMNWWGRNQAELTVLSTIGLAIITAVYVVLTGSIARSTRRQAEASREELEAIREQTAALRDQVALDRDAQAHAARVFEESIKARLEARAPTVLAFLRDAHLWTAGEGSPPPDQRVGLPAPGQPSALDDHEVDAVVKFHVRLAGEAPAIIRPVQSRFGGWSITEETLLWEPFNTRELTLKWIWRRLGREWRQQSEGALFPIEFDALSFDGTVVDRFTWRVQYAHGWGVSGPADVERMRYFPGLAATGESEGR